MSALDPARAAHEALTRRFFDLVTAKRIDAFAEIFTEDAVQENPFAPPGFPARFEGLRGMVDHYSGAVRSRRNHAFEILRVHHTLDPQVVIVQANGRSEVPESGQVYAQHYVIVFSFRDGRIARTEEYFNPLVLVGAFGGSVDTLNAIMGHTPAH